MLCSPLGCKDSYMTERVNWTELNWTELKITADGDCSHEIKRHLLLGRKAMTNLDSTLKSRDITLLPKFHIVKAMVFPIVTYGCDSWTIKKTERQRINAFELCCWRRLLRVPWTARRSNQSIRKEISPEYSLEGLMLRLKLQSFGHLIWRTDSLEKILMLGKASLTQWTWVWANSGRWWWTGKPGVLQSMGSQRVDLVTEQEQCAQSKRWTWGDKQELPSSHEGINNYNHQCSEAGK